MRDSYDKLLGNIRGKVAELREREHAHPSMSIGKYLTDVEAAVEELQQREVVGRMWRKDHTVWKPDPTEITNRLGWLTVTDVMCDQIPDLTAFGHEVRNAGFPPCGPTGHGWQQPGT